MAKIERKNMTQTVNGKITRKPKEDEADQGRFLWWKADGDDMAAQIAGNLKFIQRHSGGREEQLVNCTRLRGANASYSMMGPSLRRISTGSSITPSVRISYNLCESISETIVAQLAKNEVTPTFITSGGQWGLQKKAENLSKFTEGMFYENDVHTKITEAADDACTWGDGLTYVYRTVDDRVGVERVVPHELFVDPIETLVGLPRQLHRAKLADRDLLLEMFEDDKEASAKIRDASPAPFTEIAGMGSAADLLLVTESWRLPSSEKAKDGLRAFCLEDKLLLKEEYKRIYFPFPHLRYAKRKFGYWGAGACERLQNLQAAINREMILIDRSHWMAGSFKILVENGSKVVSQHLNNEIGAIIHYTGIAPQYVTPPAIDSQRYEYVETLIQKGYQQEGVSQMAASNLKPLGVNSGAALRTYDQISDDRQLLKEKGVEAFALEHARQGIDIVREIHKEKKSYKVSWPGVTFMQSIDWKDVNLERDEYVLKAFPTSSLPEEPMAKLQTVQEYMQSGLISPRAGRRLLRMPDVEMSDNLANAAEELIMKTIEDILYDEVENEETIRPDDEWDLQLCKQIGLQYFNFAKINNCPEDRLNALRDWMNYVNEALGLTMPPPPPPMPGGAGATVQPMAQPEPAPTSNLIPNVAGAA